jgi:oryzin
MRLSILYLALSVSLVAAQAPITNPDQKDVVPDSYIVVYKAGVSTAEMQKHEVKVHRRATSVKKGIGRRFRLGKLSGYEVHITPSELEAVRKDPAVAYVEKNGIVKTSAPVASGSIGVVRGPAALRKRVLTQQVNAAWGLGRISSRTKGSNTYVYDTTAGGGVPVYIIDTGVYIEHEVGFWILHC